VVSAKASDSGLPQEAEIKMVIALFGSGPTADSCSAAKGQGAEGQTDPTVKEHKIACSVTPGHNGMSGSLPADRGYEQAMDDQRAQ
jgi:hypothetical protein